MIRLHVVSCIVVFLVIVFFGLIRYRLRDMPLERDEGEYALSGQLMLQGIPPYKLAYNLKLPGTYAAYAAILAVFGETSAGIHLGFLIVNAATSILMYVLAARLFGRLAGVVAACSYSLMSTSPSILGFQAHATHFVVLPAILSVLLLVYALESWRASLFLASGVFAGIAFLMKQHGAFVSFFCLACLITTSRRIKRGVEPAPPKLRSSGDLALFRCIMLFVLGAILPVAITLALLYRAGVFSQFWFWTVSYAGEYSKMGLRRGVRTFVINFHHVAAPIAPVWIFAVIGVFAKRWSLLARKHSFFVNGFWLFSFIGTCPGAHFRFHYFVLLLPPTALLAGVGVSSLTERLAGRTNSKYVVAAPALAFLLCFAVAILEQRAYYFSMTPEQALRAGYWVQILPFPAAPTISEYIRAHSLPSSRIAVIGSEPEMYFYAHRLPATGYMYTYSLMEKQKYTDRMRQQMIREIETNRPEYLVYVDAWDSWGYQNPRAPEVKALFSWAKDYMQAHYERVGVAVLNQPTQYCWGRCAQDPVSLSDRAIYVLKWNK